MTSHSHTQPQGMIWRFLASVEKIGNKLPHPVTLFALFALIIFLLSGLLAYFEVMVIDPRPEGAKGRSADGMITVISLMNTEGIQRIVSGLVSNFTSFAPLGTVLVALMGVAVAEHSGLLSSAMRLMVVNASPKVVTMVVVFAGVMSNTAAELGYVVLIPLGAMIFHALGRHPLAGMAAAFAGVSGGYSANLLLGAVDPVLSGITQEAARLIDEDYVVGAEANWYFMALSTLLVTCVGAWVTQKIVEPRLGQYDASTADGELDEPVIEKLSVIEKKALWAALWAFLVLCAVLAITIVPEWGILRNPVTGAVAGSPFLKGIVAFIFVTFAIPGFIYGRIVGTMKTDRDVIEAMAKSVGTMSLYIVLVFFAAQFVAFFAWSNLGTVLAVKGAGAIQALGIDNPVVFVFFILMCAVINLMLGSASAQWAVTAPIFVPMLMLVGYAPEVIQAAYRIGDSVTNLITPMMSYFGLIMAVATRYQKDVGVGTILVMMLPYTVFFMFIWTILFYVWVFVLGMPVGPNSATYYSVQ